MDEPKCTIRAPFSRRIPGASAGTRRGRRDPETKALPLIVGLLLLTGTIFYWLAEDWTLIQSLYFSVATLTTVGYGDLTPTSDYTRIFTIIYIFLGLGVLVTFVSSIAHHYMRQKPKTSTARESI